jgi:hypothetical protein
VSAHVSVFVSVFIAVVLTSACMWSNAGSCVYAKATSLQPTLHDFAIVYCWLGGRSRLAWQDVSPSSFRLVLYRPWLRVQVGFDKFDPSIPFCQTRQCKSPSYPAITELRHHTHTSRHAHILSHTPTHSSCWQPLLRLACVFGAKDIVKYRCCVTMALSSACRGLVNTFKQAQRMDWREYEIHFRVNKGWSPQDLIERPSCHV